jgi:Na+/H+-dicarboxylate symporter/ABC-type amino acid transport substrate-binding protein
MNTLWKRYTSTALSTKILIGMIAGIVAGLVLGERATLLDPVGSGFLRLFQMPVIPYIVVSIITSIGRLNRKQAGTTFRGSVGVLAGLWVVILLVVLAFPAGFPDWKSGSFFSSSQLQEAPELSLVELFIPTNPFTALAETVVPSVVLFSIAVGIALIGVPENRAVILGLQKLGDALLGISRVVARFTPIGVFAILAKATGTTPLEAFSRIQVYVLLQALVALVLTLWVLPAAVATFTPVRQRTILRSFRAPLLTAFATGNLLIVLPLLSERCIQLLEAAPDPMVSTNSEDPAADPIRRSAEIAASVELLIPLSFVFPTMGKLLSLAFIPYAAWFSGTQIPASSYPLFLITGLASFFGDGLIAMRYLLGLLSLPEDLAELYVTIDQVSAARFGTLLAGMSTVCLALLATSVIRGQAVFRLRPALRTLAISILLLATALGLNRTFFERFVEDPNTKARELITRTFASKPDQLATVRSQPDPRDAGDDPSSLIDRIESRGSLHVCVREEDYPLSYRNREGEQVGLDVELALLFSRDLGVDAVLKPVPLDVDTPQGCDLLAAATVMTPDRSVSSNLSEPIRIETLAFLVRDEDVRKFMDFSALAAQPSLRIGTQGVSLYARKRFERQLPRMSLRRSNDIPAMLQQVENGTLDGILITAETGASLTVLDPNFALAIPRPLVQVPVGWVVAEGGEDLRTGLNAWIRMRRLDGTIDELTRHWIEGKSGVPQQRGLLRQG